MRFSDTFIEKVKTSIPIEDIISEYVRLTKKGQNYVGLCPFHSEKTPSFSVSPSKQIFHCFGCGIGGNVFTFLQKINNINFPESVEMLAKKANISLPNDNSFHAKDDSERNNIFKANEKAAYIYHYFLTNTENPAKQYCLSRNILPETIEKFNLGYAQNEWDKLYKNLLDSKFSEQIIAKAGLIKKSTRGTYIDIFRNRLIIPIYDVANHITGFGGRVLNDSDKKAPKYMNTPDTIVYHKSQLLYALNLTKNFIREQDEAIIFEGYFDVIMAYQSNIKNIVAPLGTALTKDQIKSLGRYSKNVVIVFDPDTAGEKATWRSIELLLQQNFKIKILRLPFQLDPFDYINKYGEKAFKKIKNEAPDVFTYMLNVLKTKFNLNTIYGKLKLLSYIFKYIKQIQNDVEKELIFSLLSEELKVTQDSIKIEFQKYIQNAKSFTQIKQVPKTPIAPTKKNLLKKMELEFLVLLIFNESERTQAFDFLTPDDFIHPLTAKIYSELLFLHKNSKKFDMPFYLKNADIEIQSALTGILLSQPFENLKRDKEKNKKLFYDYFSTLAIHKYNRLIANLQKIIAELSLNQELEQLKEVQKDLEEAIKKRNELQKSIISK